MKRYCIQKVVFADSLTDALKMESGGEITFIEILDKINEPREMGFRSNDNK